MKAPGNRQPTTTENSEPISSAIVKYNYQVDKTKKQPFWGMDTIILNQHLDPPTQAQQLDELSLVKGSRVSWWANESSCDWNSIWIPPKSSLELLSKYIIVESIYANHFFLSLSQCIARSGDDPWEIRGRLVAWPVWQQGFFLLASMATRCRQRNQSLRIL